VAIVAIFGGPVSQGFHLLAQAVHLLCVLLDHGVLLGEQRLLLDEFVSLRQLFSQDLLLCSHSEQFFFDRHALTLLALAPFGKSPADLGCSLEFTKTACNNPPLEWFLWQSIVVLLTIRDKCAGLRAKSNYISSHLPRLRRKIEDDPSKPVHILTEPGTGYYLVK